MKNNKMKKGEHEKAMERARDLLQKGVGMTEILEVTNLTQEDVHKLMAKHDKEYNDLT